MSSMNTPHGSAIAEIKTHIYMYECVLSMVMVKMKFASAMVAAIFVHVYLAISVNTFKACERYHTNGTLLHWIDMYAFSVHHIGMTQYRPTIQPTEIKSCITCTVSLGWNQ